MNKNKKVIMSWIFNIFSKSTNEQSILQQQQQPLDSFESLCGICGENNHSSIQCHTFKTKICWHWEKGFCKNGSPCIFAHGSDDLRIPPEMKHDHAILFRNEKINQK